MSMGHQFEGKRQIGIATVHVIAALLVCSAITTPAVADQKIGEGCSVFNPCEDGATCQANPDFSPPLMCYPSASADNLAQEQTCLNAYSDGVASGAGNSSWDASTYGIGGEGFIFVGKTGETGNVYSQDGRYGCYVTKCDNAQLGLGGDVYFSTADYLNYDAVGGSSETITVGASVIVGVEISEVFSPNSVSGNVVGAGFIVSAGLDVSAGPVWGQCNTSLATYINPEFLYVDFASTSRELGANLRPFHTLGAALAKSHSITDGTVPTITLRSSDGRASAETLTITRPLRLVADHGPVTIGRQ